MTFELAVVIIIALLAVVLGLVCSHLLGRLEMLERSVHGGLQPPTTRLSREQFERRFATAHARSALAAEIATGIALVVGVEHDEQSDVARTVSHLSRPDLITVLQIEDLDAGSLGITTTPYLFIIDDCSVRAARPVASSADIVTALSEFG